MRQPPFAKGWLPRPPPGAESERFMPKSPVTFNEDDPLYRVVSTISRAVCTGLAWCLCSLPLVTAGAASCAALAEFSNPEHRSSHALFRTFFRNLRRCFRQATLLWLMLCALLALLGLDLIFYWQLPMRGRYLLLVGLFLLADLVIGVVRFAFYLLAEGYTASLRRLLLQAGRAALLHPAVWSCMLLIDLGLAAFFFHAPYFAFLLPVLPGVLALLHSGLISRALHPLKRGESPDPPPERPPRRRG